MNTRPLSGATVLLALAGPLVAARGGEDQPAVCDDVDALRTSLNSLQAFDIYDPNVLSVVLDLIRTEVQQLAEDASSYAEEIEVVQASAQTAVHAPTAANSSTLSDAVEAFKDLRTAVGDTC